MAEPMISIEAASQSEWIAGAVGVFGAILGSAVTVIWTEYFSTRRAKREDKQRKSVLNFAVLHKLNLIYSHAYALRRSLNEGFELAESARQTVAQAPEEQDEDGTIIRRPIFNSLFIVERANPAPRTEFSTDELWALNAAGGSDLLNAATALDSRHNALCDSFERYGRERTAVTESLRVDATDGTTASMIGSGAETLRLRLQFSALDQLLNQVAQFAADVSSEALNALELLTHAKDAPFGEKFECTLPTLDGAEVTFRASERPNRKGAGRSISRPRG